jgi:hypothetical protein
MQNRDDSALPEKSASPEENKDSDTLTVADVVPRTLWSYGKSV